MTRVKPTSSPEKSYPIEEQNQLLESTSQSSFEKDESKPSFFSSIKFLLMLMISLLVLISVIVLSVIWISTFSSSIAEQSTKVREEDFSKIVSFIERTLQDVLLVVESVKAQLYNDFNYLDPISLERHTYKTFKVVKNYLSQVVLAVYIGYPDGSNYGMVNLGDSAQYFNTTLGLDQYFWECRDIASNEYCNRTVEPNVVIPPFTSNYVAQFASTNPGNPVVTLSYADPTMPQFVFLTTVSSFTNVGTIKPGDNFSFHFAFDMSVATVSNFLIEITKSVRGSTAFVIEKKTDFIIASDDPDAVVATWDNQGVIHRKTALDFGGDISVTGNIIYNRFKTFNEIACNTKQDLTTLIDFISIQRLCTNEGIDWILVFKVPQWNYMGSMVIAIICALLGAIIIVGASISMAILFSLKIVRPFNNLIQAFEMVSNMELENLHLYKTRFSEVKSLQTHFKSMIGRIKLYRRFIPPHLLMQLDGNSQKESTQESNNENHESSTAVSNSKREESMYSKSSRSHSDLRQSGKFGKQPTGNMFSLYLEKRKVTFVNTYMQGLNQWLLSINPNECVNILSDIFESVGQIARANNGQIGKFENETLSIHFNATNDQSNHQLKGVQMSSIVLAKLNSIKEGKLSKNSILKSHQALLNDFKFRIVAHCQSNLCGNVGSKQVMNFSVLGSHQYNTEVMIEIANRFDLDIVISEELFEKNNNQFQARYVDTKDMIEDDYYSSPLLASTQQVAYHARKIYELGESNDVTADEWMYELEAKEKKNRWLKYHQACELFFASQYPQAVQVLEEYLTEKKTSDSVAESFLDRIKHLL